MHLIPHIVVSDARRALEFYRAAFGAEQVVLHLTPDGQKVLHAEVKIGKSTLMFCDEFDHSPNRAPSALGGTPVTLSLSVDDADAAFARAVAAGATETMPVQDTFWGARYGQVTDPFGHVWSYNQQIREVGPEEVKQATGGDYSVV